MVLVALKHLLFGKTKSKTLLPTARSYQSIRNDDGADSSSTAVDDEDTSSQMTSSSTIKEGFVNPRVMSDIIIGLSDGLTVPFALTAGLSGLGDAKLVITGGLAELVSGAISMGLGGYLAAQSEIEYYNFQVEKEKNSYGDDKESCRETVQEVLSEYKISHETINSVIKDLETSDEDMVHFLIRFGRGLEQPAEGRQFSSAFTIGMSYFLGGFVPLLPYFFTSTVATGLYVSMVVMLITLFAFGSLKTIFSIGSDCGRSKIIGNGFKMVLTGAIAASAAWTLVRVIE